MTRRTDTHPDLARPDASAPFFSTWRVGTPERQRQTVDAIARTWEIRPWPAEDLRGYHVYTGHDGSTLLHHSQWASEQAYEAFVKTHRQERVDEIDTAVPGIERLGLGRYRRYRSAAREDRAAVVPGCIVIVDIEFEGPTPTGSAPGSTRSSRPWRASRTRTPAASPPTSTSAPTARACSTTPSGRARRPTSTPWPHPATVSARRHPSGSGCRTGRA